jgi:geranylgeranyl pyrophosphate synthase
MQVCGQGFVEQYFGSQNQSFRTMLQAVSDVVLRNVDSVFPYDPTHEHMVQLVVSKEFESMMLGLPTDIFVDQLVRPVRAITDRQGKGWRSMGLLLASSVVGGETSKLERYTSFPEFLHTGSLIIDDIQDNSMLRRGGPCAHITYGVATAINAGTAAYFLGEGVTRDHPNLSDAQRLRIYELYFTCLRGAHVGQALDINGMHHMMEACLQANDFAPVWQTLLCCHRLKSGLPAAICARTGAVLGHATVEQEAALGNYFLSMGLAFQVIDDVINLQGFSKSLKTKAEDLIEGKITAPVVRCLMLLRDQPERQAWLWNQYAVDQADRDIGGMVKLIERSGAFDDCIREAHNLVDGAWKAVDSVVPDSFAKVCMRAFGWFVCRVRDY